MGDNCCVRDCLNYREKTNRLKALGGPHVAYYSFPKERTDRDIWIRFANRLEDDQPINWLPATSSFICSSHFVDNKKSKLPIDPNFYPTIYHGKQTKRNDTEASPGKSNRIKKRKEDAVQKGVLKDGQKCNHTANIKPKPKKRDMCTQTDIPVPKVTSVNYISIPHKGKMSMWICELTPSQVGTQVSHDDFSHRSTAIQTIDNYDNSKEQDRQGTGLNQSTDELRPELKLPLLRTYSKKNKVQKQQQQPVKKSALPKNNYKVKVISESAMASIIASRPVKPVMHVIESVVKPNNVLPYGAKQSSKPVNLDRIKNKLAQQFRSPSIEKNKKDHTSDSVNPVELN